MTVPQAAEEGRCKTRPPTSRKGWVSTVQCREGFPARLYSRGASLPLRVSHCKVGGTEEGWRDVKQQVQALGDVDEAGSLTSTVQRSVKQRVVRAGASMHKIAQAPDTDGDKPPCKCTQEVCIAK